jgi:dTDP-4-dehydrorhamnose 3,5-epimerase
MINGVVTRELVTHCDERGRLFEVLRSDDKMFQVFGQAYITTALPGVVKAWHLHKQQTDNMCVVRGQVKFALYDGREDSSTKGECVEFFLCDDNRLLLQIPAGVYHGFKNIGSEEAYVLNIPTRTYNHDSPDEYRLDPYKNDIPYDWARKDG